MELISRTRRMPGMRRAFCRGGYSGLYTLTPDSHPLLGHAPGIEGLLLAVGFSGHGFKLSPAVGQGLAELITSGSYQTLDLSPLRPTRYEEGEPIWGAYEYGLLSLNGHSHGVTRLFSWDGRPVQDGGALAPVGLLLAEIFPPATEAHRTYG